MRSMYLLELFSPSISTAEGLLLVFVSICHTPCCVNNWYPLSPVVQGVDYGKSCLSFLPTRNAYFLMCLATLPKASLKEGRWWFRIWRAFGLWPSNPQLWMISIQEGTFLRWITGHVAHSDLHSLLVWLHFAGRVAECHGGGGPGGAVTLT